MTLPEAPMRRSLLAVLTAVTLSVGLLGVPAAAAAAPPDGLTLVTVKHSLLGTHEWYQQTYRGLTVLGGFYAKHTDTRTGAVTTQDGRLAIAATVPTLARVDQNRADGMALARGGSVVSSQLVVIPDGGGTLAWRVVNDTARGAVQTLVDAGSGALVRVESLVKEANGSGRVFDPNPSVTLQRQNLTDNANRDSATFTPAYKTVTLTQLDTTGRLVGTYANNTSSGGVTSSTHTYTFNRSQAGFEQVMGYYHLTRAQEYIHTLGFTDVNNSAQNYRTTGLTDDNSFYEPSLDRITYGTGGVDDAEDAEVIWHEYGHAIQDDQVPGFGSTAQSGAIGEGFGDYWAFTMSSAVSANTATTPLACIADWDAISYTSTTPHCLRRVDGTKVYPTNVDGEVHDDGEIWSRALFDIFNSLGRTTTDTIVLEAQFSFAPNTTFTAAAQRVVTTAQALFGASAAAACTAAMHARGFI
jgi:hypothetical protein